LLLGRLGVVVVSVLAGSNPAEDDVFLRAIEIPSTRSFGGKVKPSAPYLKILWRIKEPFEVRTEIICKAKFIPLATSSSFAAT
jgi:hypothetical protein